MEEEKVALTIGEILELVYQKLRLSCRAVDIECNNDEILRRQMAFRDERGYGRCEWSNCERLFEVRNNNRLYFVGLSKTEKDDREDWVTGETANIFVLPATNFASSYEKLKDEWKRSSNEIGKYNIKAAINCFLILTGWSDGTLGMENYIKFGNFQEIMNKFSKQSPILNEYFVFSYVNGSYGKLYEDREFLWSPLFADYVVQKIKLSGHFEWLK
jgi:hypothetical protein